MGGSNAGLNWEASSGFGITQALPRTADASFRRANAHARTRLVARGIGWDGGWYASGFLF